MKHLVSSLFGAALAALTLAPATAPASQVFAPALRFRASAVRLPASTIASGCVAHCGEPRAHTYMQVDPAIVHRGGSGPYYFGSWTTISGYLDVLTITGGNLNADASAAGIATGFYIDANACSGTAANAYPFTPSAANKYAALDCSTVPPYDFYAQDGTANLLTKYLYLGSSGVYEQRLLAPANAANDPAFASAVRTVIANESQGAPFSFVFLDDALSPAEHMSYAVVCNGPQQSAHVLDQTCATAPGGKALAPPSTFSTPSWQAGQTKLMQMLFSTFGLRAMPNGITSLDGTPSANVGATLASASAWGGMCEACLTSFHSRWQLDGALASIAATQRAGKNVVIYNDTPDGATIPQRINALARMMLVYDRDHTYEGFAFPNGVADQQGCGLHSHSSVCPEVLMTYAAGTSQPAFSVDRYGNYTRTIDQCLIGGVKVPIGASGMRCTIVFNPNTTPTQFVPVPALLGSLARLISDASLLATVGIAGDSLCGCSGDTTGSLTIGMSPMPAATGTLAPNSGVIMVSFVSGLPRLKMPHRA